MSAGKEMELVSTESVCYIHTVFNPHGYCNLLVFSGVLEDLSFSPSQCTSFLDFLNHNGTCLPMAHKYLRPKSLCDNMATPYSFYNI